MDFLNKTHCDRCMKRLSARITSMFNMDTICLDCMRKEEAHPDYEKAKKAELEAVKHGNLNFKGIGLPSDLR